MSTLFLIGAGGHGKVVLDIARTMGRFENIYFLDDDPAKQGSSLMGAEIAGSRDSLPRAREGVAVFAAIGFDNELRLSLTLSYLDQGYEVPVLAHPSAVVSPSAVVGPGTAIMAQAAVNAQAYLGPACIVNTGATVDHDCKLAGGVHLAPGVNLSGETVVGERTLIGTGANVIHGIEIGQRCLVGAGAAVVQDVEDDTTVVGVPAKPMEAKG